MTNQSDIPKLLERLDKLLKSADEARGTSQQLIKALPLEISLYNLATVTRVNIEKLRRTITL